MKTHLMQLIIEGTPIERENAAVEMCQSKLLDIHDDLQPLLNHHNEDIRETAVLIMGVFGQDKSIQQLKGMSKNDPSTNVRVAAIIAREYSGKLTYDQLKAEIRRFRKGSQPELNEELEKKEPKKQDKKSRPAVRTLADLEEEAKTRKLPALSIAGIKNFFVDYRNRLIIAASCILAVVLIVQLFKTMNNSDTVQEKTSRIGAKMIGASIRERIEGISEFKSRWLDPDSPESRYPMTLELRTLEGETYGGLFERVYGNIFPTVEGMNTLGAFWRHVNFGLGEKQRDVTLMEQETEGELLLFPNLPAMNIMLNVEDGDAAFQGLNGTDPDLKIHIQIDNVTVR